MARVLLVEDDDSVRAALARALTRHRHTVRAVGTALAALHEIASERPDLVVLDLGLPDLDGDAALRMLRGISTVPVIIATARGDEQSVVRLLNSGADDYIVKPFSSEHLVARMNALLRRVPGTLESTMDVLSVGELRIDVNQREVRLGSEVISLSRREFDLLAYLGRRAGKVISRQELVKSVWRQPYGLDTQSIDVHVSWLRRKLGESAAEPRYLHTVRGVGLKLAAPE